MLLNIKLYVLFALMGELAGPPLFPVIVCAIESLFVQTIVSPFLMVIDDGLKEKFWIVTLCVTGIGTCVVGEFGIVVVCEELVVVGVVGDCDELSVV